MPDSTAAPRSALVASAMNLWRPDRPTQAAMELLTPEMMQALRALAPKRRSSKVARVFLVAATLVVAALTSDASSREFFATKGAEIAARVRHAAPPAVAPAAEAQSALAAPPAAALAVATPEVAATPEPAAVTIPVVEMNLDGAAASAQAEAPEITHPRAAHGRRPAKAHARPARGKR